MAERRKLLLCVDGSENSVRAAMYIRRILSGTDALITVLHVVTPKKAIELKDCCDDWEAEAEKYILPCLEVMEKSDLEHITLIQIGDAAEVILEISHKYDGMVMGYKGHSAITSVLMGSVTNKIIRDSTVAVTLVP